MSDGWIQRLERALRCLVPFLTGLVAILLDVTPLSGPAPHMLAPFMTLAVVYFWSLYRPDLMPPVAAFALGLAFDLLAGLPLGMTAIVLLVTHRLVLTPQRPVLAASFSEMWAGCFVVAVAVAVVRWTLASVWWTHGFALRPDLFQTLATAALFPAVAWLLLRCQPLLPPPAHAPRG
jgi:rod shape-determining protein MreD